MKQLILWALGLMLSCPLCAQDRPEQPIPVMLHELRTVATDTARLHLLLTIADAYVLKPGEDKTDLDSASLLIEQVGKANATIKDPRIQGLCLLFKAKADREKGNKDIAKANALRSVQLFRRYKAAYPAELAYADVEAANHFSYEDESEDSQRVALYREAIPLFEATGRRRQQAETLQIMGECIMTGFADATDGLPYLLEAVKLFRSIGYTDLRYIYGLLGRGYSVMGDYRSALKYGLQAKAIEDTTPYSISRYFTDNRLGLTYHHLGVQDTAETCFRKALATAEHFHDTNAIQQAAFNLANCLVSQNKFDTAGRILDRYSRRYPFAGLFYHNSLLALYCGLYLHTQRLQQAKTIVRQLIRTDSALQSGDFLLTIVDPPVVRYFLAAKDYDKARRYAIRFRDYCLRQKIGIRLAEPYHWLFEADSAQGRWELALHAHQHYMVVRDSLLDINNRKQVAALQFEYETEKKDRDIQYLTQKRQLDQLALHQASLTRNFIIISSGFLLLLLLVLLGIAVRRYRLKQRSNKQLSHLLTEKEWLVKEIHHRVKNNLHTISGLLSTQADFLENTEAVSAVRESQRRVDAMSLIHQKLYNTSNLSDTDMEVYIQEFVSYLQASFDCGSRIRFHLDVESCRFPLTHSIPLSLILNEAVTNAIKYAFPGDLATGIIAISLQRRENRQFILTISDDGIGIPAGPSRNGNASMGMRLMQGLSEDIGGRFSIDGRNGTRIQVVFEYYEIS